MREVLSPLRTSKTDEAMSAIESINMPAPSIAMKEPRADFYQLRELSHTALKVPFLLGRPILHFAVYGKT